MLSPTRLIAFALLGLGAYGGYQYAQVGELDILKMLEGIPTNTLIIAALVGAIVFGGRKKSGTDSATNVSVREARMAQLRAEGMNDRQIEARLDLDALRPREAWLNRALLGVVPVQIFHQCFYAAQDSGNPLQSGLIGFGYALVAILFTNLCITEGRMAGARERLTA